MFVQTFQRIIVGFFGTGLNNSMQWLDIVLFFVPIVTGYTMSAICPMRKSAGSNIRGARPPAWVFGVVWPILYLLMGLSWVQLRRQLSRSPVIVDILFTALVVTLNVWLLVYSCARNAKGALYVLILALMLSLCTWGYSAPLTPFFYLTPLVAWLIFALLLNFSEVNAA